MYSFLNVTLFQVIGVAQHAEKTTLHDETSATNARAQKTLAVTARGATIRVVTTTDAATIKGTAEPTGSAKNVRPATVPAIGTVTSAPEINLGMEQEEVAQTVAEGEQVQVTAEPITTTGSQVETLNDSFQFSEGAIKIPSR